MSAALVADVHGRLVRIAADATGIHFQGLRAAAGHLRRAGLIDQRLTKSLTRLDDAAAILRHITSVSADEIVERLSTSIASAPAQQSVPREERSSSSSARSSDGGCTVRATNSDAKQRALLAIARACAPRVGVAGHGLGQTAPATLSEELVGAAGHGQGQTAPAEWDK